MHDLEITWPTGRARFSADDSPVEVGRSPDAAVVLTDPSVSRRHIDFVWNGTAWTAMDSSTHGSFDPIGVRLAPTWTVGTNTTVRLGGMEGVELRIELVTTRPSSMSAPIPTSLAPPVIETPPGPPSLSVFAPPVPAPMAARPAPAPIFFPPPSELDLRPVTPANQVPSGTPAPPAPPAPPAAFDPAPPAPPAPPVPQSSAPTSLHHLAATTIVGDDTISLSIDGRDYTFLPGTEITVGRDPACLVSVDERHALVSRRHLVIAHHDNSWWIEDSSTKGTFVDGRKISGPVRAEGAFLAQLGDDNAGVALKIITSGDHRVRKQQNIPLLVAIAVLGLIAVGALFLALQRRNDSPIEAGATAATVVDSGAQAAADLASAKQSTVMLLADDGLGSGFFVSDNLIVTNQHVAALAPSLFVAVSRTADEPAQVEYEAEVVALHPYLDIAVLRLTVDANQRPVASADLPAVTIGDSSKLTLGDAVYNTGFPAPLSLISLDDMGELQLPPVSATRGEAASFSIWPGCSNPDQASFIPIGSPPGVVCAPDGDVARGVVITTFASGQGASGSPVFRGDEVVAVVFAGPEDEANAGRNIATAAFSDWLDQTIAANS